MAAPNPLRTLVSGIAKTIGLQGGAQPVQRNTAQSFVRSIMTTAPASARSALANTKFSRGVVKGGKATRSSGYSNMISSLRAGTPGVAGTWGGAGYGFMAGGFAANYRSDESQRGVGTFIKGGLWGAVGGAALSKGLSQGAMNKKAGNMLADQLGKSGGKLTRGVSFSHGAWQAARLVESAEARSYAFASGAMLTGGFMGGDRSRAHGFNANRGNRFSG